MARRRQPQVTYRPPLVRYYPRSGGACVPRAITTARVLLGMPPRDALYFCDWLHTEVLPETGHYMRPRGIAREWPQAYDGVGGLKYVSKVVRKPGMSLDVFARTTRPGGPRAGRVWLVRVGGQLGHAVVVHDGVVYGAPEYHPWRHQAWRPVSAYVAVQA